MTPNQTPKFTPECKCEVKLDPLSDAPYETEDDYYVKQCPLCKSSKAMYEALEAQGEMEDHFIKCKNCLPNPCELYHQLELKAFTTRKAALRSARGEK